MSTELETTFLAEEMTSDILDEYLAFVSDGLNFAVSANYVIEIITNHVITKLPRVPEYIRGLYNLRGQVIPILDARLRMRQTPDPESDVSSKCVIVIDCNDVSIGLLVDGVSHVVNIDDNEILPPPANNRQELVSGIVHLGAEDYLILDCQKLVG